MSDLVPQIGSAPTILPSSISIVAKSDVHGPFMQNTGFVLPGFPHMALCRFGIHWEV